MENKLRSECPYLTDKNEAENAPSVILCDMPIHDVKYRIGLKMILHKIIEPGAGDEGLDPLNAPEELILAAAVQFGQDVVKKKHRGISGVFADHAVLRKFQ